MWLYDKLCWIHPELFAQIWSFPVVFRPFRKYRLFTFGGIQLLLACWAYLTRISNLSKYNTWQIIIESRTSYQQQNSELADSLYIFYQQNFSFFVLWLLCNTNSKYLFAVILIVSQINTFWLLSINVKRNYRTQWHLTVNLHFSLFAVYIIDDLYLPLFGFFAILPCHLRAELKVSFM